MTDPMSNANVTELRMNTKAAIEAVNSLAKRLEAANQQIALHEEAITNLAERTNILMDQNYKMQAKLYEAGVR